MCCRAAAPTCVGFVSPPRVLSTAVSASPKGFERCAWEGVLARVSFANRASGETRRASRDPSLRGGNGLVYRSRSFSRREALKLGALGSAGLLLPFERYAGAAGGKGANRIASSNLPAPFTVPFVRPPVLSPVRTDATTDYYRLVQQQALVEILPGQADGDLRLQRHHARARRSWRSGTGQSSCSRSTPCRRCIRRSATRRRPRRTCTARRRCRSTTATRAM